MFNCVSGRVPPRLVYLLQRCPGTRQIQIVFEWDAEWPTKYVIECHDGPYIVARSDLLPWATVFEWLKNEYDKADGNLSAWYLLVLSRLREEGGSTV